MVTSGYGSGIGSSVMSGLQGLTSMVGPQGMIIGSVASSGLDVISFREQFVQRQPLAP
jgi:hypothetical protein